MNNDEWWTKIIIVDCISENYSGTICLLGKQKNSLGKAVPVQYKWAMATALITLLQAVYSCAHLHTAGETFGLIK